MTEATFQEPIEETTATQEAATSEAANTPETDDESDD